PPGPRGLPIIGNVLEFNPANAWRLYDDFKKRYGPIVYLNLLGQDIVIINAKKVANDLLVRRAVNYSDRPRMIESGEYLTRGMNMIVARYGELWHKMRRSSQSALSARTVNRYHPVQSDEMVIMTYGMMHDPDHWKEQILRAMSSVILSIVYDLPPSKSLNDPFATKVNQFVNRVSSASYPGNLVDLFPVLDYIPTWASKWKRKAEKDFAFYSALFGEKFEAIKGRVMNQEENRTSFCASVAENQEKMSISDIEAAWLTGTLYQAGHDTNYSTITWFIFAVLHYPQVLEKAQQELDRIVGKSRLPSFADFKSLPYIRAIVKETLRWRPVAPLGVAHSTLEDDFYEGYHIPKGTLCLANIWSMNHDTEVYGSDADAFRPERYLDDKTGELKDSSDEGHVSYGFGYRDCVGRHLANDSLFIAIAMISWSMKIEPKKDVNDGRDVVPPIDGVDTDGFIVRPPSFGVTLIPRFPEAETILRQARDDILDSESY
ncbi:cytochrome P450, partial [Dendrothele bispora CBS 962.96]